MLWYLLVFIVIFVATTLLLKLYAEKVFQLMTTNRHKDGDFLFHTGLAPQWWKKRLSFRIALLFSQEAAHKRAVQRVKSLKNYFLRTPLVDSEEVRKSILDALSELENTWATLTWDQLFQESTQNDIKDGVYEPR